MSKPALPIVLALCALAALVPASPALAEGACPNEALRTGPSAHLPDCRAYELVTPSYKNTGNLANLNGVGSDEETVTFASFSAFGEIESAEGASSYEDRRGPTGWGTFSPSPPAREFLNLDAGFHGAPSGSVVGWSADRRSVLFVLHELSQPANQAGLYLREPGGSLVEVGPAIPPGSPPVINETIASEASMHVEGLSADGSRVVFTSGEPGHEWGPEAQGLGRRALLEYIGTGNSAPIPVGVENDGHTPVDGCPSQRLGGQLKSEFSGGQQEGWTHNAVSTDSETVFLTDTCHGQIFARIGNGQLGAHTVAISEPTTTGSSPDCPACDTAEAVREPAYFEGASRDGSKVFWSTEQPLLGTDTSENIYEYNFAAPAGQRVTRVSVPETVIEHEHPDTAARVQGLVQTSEDGSHVYFVAAGVLTKGLNGQGQQAQEGAHNLYVFDGETGTTAFIASLASNDNELWEGAANTRIPEASSVTLDGRFLVFVSHTDLTPDDTSSATQVFEYDAQTGVLTRVSVGQDGYNDDGNTSHSTVGTRTGSPQDDDQLEDPNDALIPYGRYDGSYEASAYYNGLAVSADGAYVFFESTDGLTPQAFNHEQIHPGGAIETEREGQYGPTYARNVYEYHDGEVYLISDGMDTGQDVVENTGVLLGGTDPSGRDVFFATTDQLVAQDTDTNEDWYDARIEGGFPALSVPAECEDDACQGLLSAAPTLLSPGSELQAGGNPPPAGSPATGTSSSKPRTSSRAQKLSKALRVCRKKPKHERGVCARKARRAYGRGK